MSPSSPPVPSVPPVTAVKSLFLQQVVCPVAGNCEQPLGDPPPDSAPAISATQASTIPSTSAASPVVGQAPPATFSAFVKAFVKAASHRSGRGVPPRTPFASSI